MAGIIAKRQQYHDIKNAREFQDTAVLEQQDAADEPLKNCPSVFQEKLTRLTNATDKLASAATNFMALLTNIQSSYGDVIGMLQKDNERCKFTARYCNFVTQFEERVFHGMRSLPKYKEALAAGAEPLEDRQEALELLWDLANAEQEWDADVRTETLTQGNLLMRDAWNESVVLKGLALNEYAELRIFKDDTNSFHQPSSPAQALAELKTSPPLPDPYTRVQPTLTKLLELLSGP